MFHTKVWNIGAGSAHKCGTTLTAVEWPTLFHTWVWNIYQQSLHIDVLTHELTDSPQQSISPPKIHEQNWINYNAVACTIKLNKLQGGSRAHNQNSDRKRQFPATVINSTADNVRVVWRGVESSQVVLTTRTLQSRRTVRVREDVARSPVLGSTALAPMIRETVDSVSVASM
jgi:hypothetical protein